MKFIVKFMGLLFVAIFCSFNIIGVNASVQHLNFKNASDHAKASHQGTISSTFLYTSSESESVVFELENTYRNSTEDPFKNSSSVAKITEQLFLNAYTQYNLISRNFLIKFRKKDLIFPSHYFW